MKLLLAKNQEVGFAGIVGGGKCASLNVSFLEKEISPLPVTDDDRKLVTALGSMIECYKQLAVDNSNMSVYVRHFNTTSLQAMLQLFQTAPLLTNLAALFGKDNFLVKVTLTNFQRRNPKTTYKEKAIKDLPICSKGMKVPQEPEGMWTDSNLQFPNSEVFGLFYGSGAVGQITVVARITIEIDINVGARQSLPITMETPKPKVISKTEIYEKMLNDEVHADVVIVAKNGIPVKCHKAVLCSSSDVFAAMFQTDMAESTNNQVEMPDMTEEAVRAFLKFIYYQDEEAPGEDPRIAFELLTAAHKYNVTPDLETAMANLFLSKEEEWCDLDVAVDVFQFARSVPARDELKSVSVKILKRNISLLREVPSYMKLFIKNPEAAMELFELAVSSK